MAAADLSAARAEIAATHNLTAAHLRLPWWMHINRWCGGRMNKLTAAAAAFDVAGISTPGRYMRAAAEIAGAAAHLDNATTGSAAIISAARARVTAALRAVAAVSASGAVAHCKWPVFLVLQPKPCEPKSYACIGDRSTSNIVG